jgi:hypothetical protein
MNEHKYVKCDDNEFNLVTSNNIINLISIVIYFQSAPVTDKKGDKMLKDKKKDDDSDDDEDNDEEDGNALCTLL